MAETAPDYIIRYASLPAQKWRNGGGTTVEIARSPTTAVPGSAGGPAADVAGAAAPATAGAAPGAVAAAAVDSNTGGATATDWQWRISIAEVSTAGDFSAFPGCERILTVIDGEFMLLTVGGEERGLQPHRPFRFAGEAPTSAALPEGPIRDLNVITGPGHRGHVVIVELSKQRPHPVFGGQFAVLLQGRASVAPGTAGASDAAAVQETGPGVPLAGASAARPSPLALERLDTVVGDDNAPPHIVGRGHLAVISIDPR